MSPQCYDCGRFMKVLGCRNNGAHGYGNAWYAIGECSRCGEQGIDWEWLGDYDPEVGL
jgi:hypothetical protein